eukprot:TRINITY_DN30971_c0_g1_i1.p1 TRINITY_DN30971_c0_g1~~TRINITY_DN30971_c0_g1_i1.p1  ORF type:complete len:320 (+),score=95.11 TRINITY_DN30971_c0_g1_i1:79-1038(+)
MPFSVIVATDIFGRKHNREFVFPARPYISDLTNVVESHFDTVGRANRPAGHPDIPYRAHTFQLFDGLMMRWTDLFSAEQLTDGVQVFAFQPESLWHSDLQETVPVDRPVITWMSSGSRRVVGNDTGVPPLLRDKLRWVFAALDDGRKGHLAPADFSNGFARAGICLVSTSPQRLHAAADTDRDGCVTYGEWAEFAIKSGHQDLADALFFRLRDQDDRLRDQDDPPALACHDPSEVPVARIARRSAAERERARYQQEEKEQAWWEARVRAQERYERARGRAALARSQARVATERERKMYEELYAPAPPLIKVRPLSIVMH